MSEIAYICSPYRAKTEEEKQRNIEYAKDLTAMAINMGYAPITPHLYLPDILDDNDEEQREKALEVGRALVLDSNIIIVGERYGISEGMERELRVAEDCGIFVFKFLDKEIPWKPNSVTCVDVPDYSVYECGRCRAVIFVSDSEDAKNHARYCQCCGQKIDWRGV